MICKWDVKLLSLTSQRWCLLQGLDLMTRQPCAFAFIACCGRSEGRRRWSKRSSKAKVVAGRGGGSGWETRDSRQRRCREEEQKG